ncbi:MAG: P13 family porin [Treponema sp.]
MKKSIAICILLLSICGIYAAEQEKSNQTVHYMEIDSLIQKGLFKNKELISQQAKNLTDEQIFSLQQRHTKNYSMPLFLNGLFGFGSGNFYAGDNVGGAIHAVIDIAGILTTTISAGIYIRTITDSARNIDSLESFEKSTKRYLYTALVSTSIITLNKLISLITASTYVKKYNLTLTEALAASRTAVSVQTVPVFAHDHLGLAFNINY